MSIFCTNCLNRLKLFAFQSNKWSKDRKNKLEGCTLAMSFIAQTYFREYRDTLLNVFLVPICSQFHQTFLPSENTLVRSFRQKKLLFSFTIILPQTETKFAKFNHYAGFVNCQICVHATCQTCTTFVIRQ
jgi:hypothetical protein